MNKAKPVVEMAAKLAAQMGFDDSVAMLEAAANNYRQSEIDALVNEGVHKSVAEAVVNARFSAATASKTAPDAETAETLPDAEAQTAAETPDDLVLLDTFIATAYCVTGTTSTGTYTTVNRTLAVNPEVIPYGTHVWLYLDDGTFVGDYYAEDTGSNMMENPYVIDIYMGEDSYNECILWGAQHVSVYVEADAS